MRIRLFTSIIIMMLLNTTCDNDNNELKVENDIYYQSFAIDYTKIKNDTFYYDLNNDTTIDIIAIRHTDTIQKNELRCSGKIYSLKDTMLFTFMRIRPTTAMLDTNDIINNSINYSWIDTIKYTGNMWQGIFTPNFGFQIKNKGLNFGWFHFDTGLLKEIAINRTKNTSIRLGQIK
jgi:hypothetical protein